jgi:hypothetical protein
MTVRHLATISFYLFYVFVNKTSQKQVTVIIRTVPDNNILQIVFI